MNIYITPSNEEKLRQQTDYTMSGLINKLLTDFFGSSGWTETGSSRKTRVFVANDGPTYSKFEENA